MADGLYLTGFLDAYLKAQERNRLERSQALTEAINASNLGAAQEERTRERQVEADIADLFRSRRAAPFQVPPGAAPQPSAAPGPPGMAGVYAPGPERSSLTESMTPEALQRVTMSPQGRIALATVEKSEADVESRRRQREGYEALKQADEAFKNLDMLAGAQLSARGLRLLGEPQEASKWMEHAKNLLSKPAEQERMKKDVALMEPAFEKWYSEASPKAFFGVLGLMPQMESTIGQTFLAKKLDEFGKEVPLLSKQEQVRSLYAELFRAHAKAKMSGKPYDADEVTWKVMDAADPKASDLLLYDSAVNHKALSPALQRWFNVNEDVDLSKIRGDFPTLLAINAAQLRTTVYDKRVVAKSLNEMKELSEAKRPETAGPEGKEAAELRRAIDHLHMNRREMERALRSPTLEDKEAERLRREISRTGQAIKEQEADYRKLTGRPYMEPKEEPPSPESQTTAGKLIGQKPLETMEPEERQAAAADQTARMFPGKRWEQLTPEQKKKVAAGLNAMEQKIRGAKPAPAEVAGKAPAPAPAAPAPKMAPQPAPAPPPEPPPAPPIPFIRPKPAAIPVAPAQPAPATGQAPKPVPAPIRMPPAERPTGFFPEGKARQARILMKGRTFRELTTDEKTTVLNDVARALFGKDFNALAAKEDADRVMDAIGSLGRPEKGK